MKAFLITLVLVCIALTAWTQTPSPSSVPAKAELPSGPLLHSPGDYAQWEITFTYPAEKKKPDGAKKADASKKNSSRKARPTPSPTPPPSANPDARPRKILTTKTGRIVHEESTDVAQRKTDTWFVGGSQYVKSGESGVWSWSDKQIGSTGSLTGTDYHPLPAIGYHDVEWIKAENYVGKTAYKGRDCMVFVSGGAPGLDLGNAAEAEKKLATMESVAYVDAETRRPVSLRTHSETRDFQFNSPPVQMQTLPDDLVAQIKQGEDGRARLEQPASRPD